MPIIQEVIIIDNQMNIIMNDIGFSINDKINYQILARENNNFIPLIQDEYIITNLDNMNISINLESNIIMSNLLKIVVEFNNLQDNRYINNTSKKNQNKILIKQIEDTLSLELEEIKEDIKNIDITNQISDVLKIIYDELLPLIDKEEINKKLIQDVLNSMINKLINCQEQINFINHHHLDTQIKLNELRHSLKSNVSEEIYSYKFVLEILFYLLNNGVNINKMNQKLNNHIKLINTNISYISTALELINNKIS